MICRFDLRKSARKVEHADRERMSSRAKAEEEKTMMAQRGRLSFFPLAVLLTHIVCAFVDDYFLTVKANIVVGEAPPPLALQEHTHYFMVDFGDLQDSWIMPPPCTLT